MSDRHDEVVSVDAVHSTDFPVAASASGTITSALQAAIDMARAAGGGRVIVPSGVWACGAIRLFSDIELHLSRGAVLRAARDYDAYRNGTVASVAEGSDRALIVAHDARNVAITGPGRIDGQGDAWSDGTIVRGVKWMHRHRPRIIVLEGCANIRVANLTIVDAPMWTIHLIGCRDIEIAGCTIRNDLLMPNTDGVNFDGCQDAALRDTTIETADDCVCVKTAMPLTAALAQPCARILVTGCRFRSNSCALKIGTETHNDIRDVLFSDCRVTGSNRAFGIFSRDGGAIERIGFENSAVECCWTPDGFWGNGEAVAITAMPRLAGQPAGPVRDVTMRNITGTMESAITLLGTGPRPLERIALADLEIAQRAGDHGNLPDLDLRPTMADVNDEWDPATGRGNAWRLGANGRVIGLMPYPGGLPGLHAEHVAGLTLHAVQIHRPEPLPAGWAREIISCGAGVRMSDVPESGVANRPATPIAPRHGERGDA